MPFIHKHKLLYIHIPKTGGSSIERKFNINETPGDYTLYEEKETRINNISYAPQHLVPNLIRTKHEQLYNEYKKFTIVRNPYTRIISEYFDYYWTRVNQPINNLNNLQKFLYDEKIMFTRDHTLPQKKYFENIKYDYVLKFENLNVEFSNMAKKFNFSGTLQHYNKSKTNILTQTYIKDLNKKCIEKINTLYSEDFELLNYSFL